MYINSQEQLDSLSKEELHNLKWLNCWDTQVSSISKELVNLEKLICSNTQISSIPKELVNLKWLSCCDTQVSSIPKELVNLEKLDCSNTQIPKLDLEPFKVYNLNSEVLKIGCQIKRFEEWINLSKEDIQELDERALKFYNKYKDQIIKWIKEN